VPVRTAAILSTTSSLGDAAEDGVAVLRLRVIEESIVGEIHEELRGCVLTSLVRAIDSVPRSFLSPLVASFAIGARVFFG